MKSILIGLSLLAAFSQARAAELGDPAAELKIAKWAKGEPVELSDKGIYVVEFWATWCPPCRTSIPHLTEIQKRFKDKVTIIGISDEKESTVAPFVKQWGDKMNYTVAVDDGRKTSEGYMGAYEIGGIPHAFVVKDKKVVWHGHPMAGLDKALEEITSGKYNLDTAKKRAQSEALTQQFMQAVYAGEDKDAEEIAARIKAIDPEANLDGMRKEVTTHKLAGEYLDSTTEGKTPKNDKGEELAGILKDQPRLANEIAWQILTNPRVATRDLPLATKIAKRACDDSKWENPDAIDTYARALFDSGKKDEAVKNQEKAVSLGGENKEQFEKTLAAYKQGKLPEPE